MVGVADCSTWTPVQGMSSVVHQARCDAGCWGSLKWGAQQKLLCSLLLSRHAPRVHFCAQLSKFLVTISALYLPLSLFFLSIFSPELHRDTFPSTALCMLESNIGTSPINTTSQQL